MGMQIVELYQEEPGGTFTNDGREYDLNKVLADVDDFPKVLFFTQDLKWLLDSDESDATVNFDRADIRRIEQADLSTPILVAYYGSRFVVVDGLHRLIKAVRGKKRFMRGVLVPTEVLDRDEVLSERYKQRRGRSDRQP